MSDFLNRIVAKNLNHAGLIEPRLRLRYEPPSLNGEMVFGPDNLSSSTESSAVRTDEDFQSSLSLNPSLEISQERLLGEMISEQASISSGKPAKKGEKRGGIEQFGPIGLSPDMQMPSNPGSGQLPPAAGMEAAETTARPGVLPERMRPAGRILNRQIQPILDQHILTQPIGVNEAETTAGPGLQIEKMPPIGRIVDREIQANTDQGIPTQSAGVEATEDIAGPELLAEKMRPIGRIVNREIQASPDQGIPTTSAGMDVAEEIAGPGLLAEKMRPIGRIVNREIQASPDQGIPTTSAGMDVAEETAGPGLLAEKMRPIGRIVNREIQASPDQGIPTQSAGVEAAEEIAGPGLLAEKMRPIGRIFKRQIQPILDQGILTTPAGVETSETTAGPGLLTEQMQPTGIIVDRRIQLNPDQGILTTSAGVTRSQKIAAQETEIGRMQPTGRIANRRIQLKSDPRILISSASAAETAKRAEPEPQSSQFLPAGRPFNNLVEPSPIIRSSGGQTESGPQAAIALSVPAIVRKPDKKLKKEKIDYLQVGDSPADRGLQRNALLLSAKKEALMQSRASVQDALSPKSRRSPTKTDRKNDQKSAVYPIISRHDEVLNRDKRMDVSSGRSSSESFSSIKVNIGRIEVRAAGKESTHPPSHQKPAATSKSGLSLDDYLKRPR